MKFGQIELDPMFGGMEIVNKPANKLPQEVASACACLNSSLLGATYMPIWYVGRQLVNGYNYFLICEEIRVTKEHGKMIVGVKINVPAGPDSFTGANAKIVEIVEECNLEPEVRSVFNSAMNQLVGVHYKPLAYIGHQIVNGVNHYILCEAKAVYPGADPRAVIVCINEKAGAGTIVSIETVEAVEDDEKSGGRLGKPLGEWP